MRGICSPEFLALSLVPPIKVSLAKMHVCWHITLLSTLCFDYEIAQLICHNARKSFLHDDLKAFTFSFLITR